MVVCFLHSISLISFFSFSDQQVASVKAKVYGILAGVKIPFPFPHGDACQSSGLTCPLNPGNHTYSSKLKVQPIFPSVSFISRTYFNLVTLETISYYSIFRNAQKLADLLSRSTFFNKSPTR